MEDDGYLDLQEHYSGEYVVRRGREVLRHSPSYKELANWLYTQRPLPDGVVVAYVARPDVFAIY